MIISITFISFIFLFFLPFIPGFIEIAKKKDADPLPITMDYIRHPRYFAKSFKRILERATIGFRLSCGIQNVKLSKDETLEIRPALTVPDAVEINHLLCIKGNLVSGADVKLNKEVYSSAGALIGPNSIIQALSTDGNAEISQGSRFRRWLDAEGDIIIREKCNLGISATSNKKIYLAEACVFRRLFGRPIITGNPTVTCKKTVEISQLPVALLRNVSTFNRKKDTIVPSKTKEDNNIVFTNNVRIGHGSIFRGDIKSYGTIILEEDITVCGNVIADGDVIVGRNVKIGGHLFSQASLHISEGSCLGCSDKIKSIIAKKAIHIENNVIIYGYVSTEGIGTTG